MSDVKVGGEVRGPRKRLKMPAEEFEWAFKPMFDWCLIKMTDREKTLPKIMLDAGLVEAGMVNTQARNKDGVIISMGPCDRDEEGNKVYVPPGLEIGARVFYSAWSGRETPCPKGYILVKVNDILCLLDEDVHLEWI